MKYASPSEGDCGYRLLAKDGGVNPVVVLSGRSLKK
jgi:hypothetical protein